MRETIDPNASWQPWQGIRCWRENGAPRTNVPRVCIHHSPDGHNWGYCGSGPADLALDACNGAFPPRLDGESPVRCYRGWSSLLAWNLHQLLKVQLLAALPAEGGEIAGYVLVKWFWNTIPTFPRPLAFQAVVDRLMDFHFTTGGSELEIHAVCRFCREVLGPYDLAGPACSISATVDTLQHVLLCTGGRRAVTVLGNPSAN